jgi:hypothetical protein
MNLSKMTLGATVVSCLAVLLLTIPVAALQDDAAKSRLAASKAPKVEEKKANAKKIEAHFKVSVRGGGPMPTRCKVEISGQDQACGNLSDMTAVIDETGEATFRGLPACKVSVKIVESLYLPFRMTVDLADYKAPIELILIREQ